MTDGSEIPPVLKEVVVHRSVTHAFATFTHRIGAWWPMALSSVGGEKAKSVKLEPRVGGRLVELTHDGTEHVWGTVEVYEPPKRVAFSWHPGSDPAFAQTIDVCFSDVDGGTKVVLAHTGWAKLGELGRETRDDYQSGWDLVFVKEFGNLVRAPAEFSVLLHKPGPSWRQGVQFRDQPGVAAHVQFMMSLHDTGLLYLGGPFMDDSGAMAIVTVGVEEAREIIGDDPALESGLLEIDVHPWMTTMGCVA